ncbi:MAG: c-type cytochrome [Chitinophagaceae bacterium]|nr:c-type cytochrome [Chitinophagaceae bacterium]
MRKSIFILSAISIVIAAVVVCSSKAGNTGNAKSALSPDSASLVKRGEYLVNSVGCDDCHSPKRMGAQGPELIPELRLSGFPHDGKLPPMDTNVIKNGWALLSPDLTSAAGAWGQSFAANITSDATGIGNWTEQNFLTAIRHGKLKGLENSRTLLPPMPWFVYKNMTDDDLRSIFYYLKTTRPVKNIVPGPKAPGEL